MTILTRIEPKLCNNKNTRQTLTPTPKRIPMPMGIRVARFFHLPNIDHRSNTSISLDLIHLFLICKETNGLNKNPQFDLSSLRSPSIALKSSFDSCTNSPAMQSRTKIWHRDCSLSKSSVLQLAFFRSNSVMIRSFRSPDGNIESTNDSSFEFVILPSFSPSFSSPSALASISLYELNRD